MIGMARIDGVGKTVAELKVGDTFTQTGEYTPEKTRVYTVQKIMSGDFEGCVIAQDDWGMNRTFEPDEIVYPV